jgi:regulator of replication initiation timing
MTPGPDTGSATMYEYLFEMGRNMEQMDRRLRKRNKKLRRLVEENNRMREEIERLSAMRSHYGRSIQSTSQNADNGFPPNESHADAHDPDVAATDDERVDAAPTFDAVLLEPTRVPTKPNGKDMSIESWRRSRGIATKNTLDLKRRFIQNMQTAKTYLIGGNHILITNIGNTPQHPNYLTVQYITPVLYTLSVAAGPQRGVLPGVIDSVEGRSKSNPVGGGLIIPADLTRQLIEEYHVPACTDATWSFLLPGVTNIEQFRSVMAYAQPNSRRN